jgi:hypothetical protein
MRASPLKFQNPIRDVYFAVRSVFEIFIPEFVLPLDPKFTINYNITLFP